MLQGLRVGTSWSGCARKPSSNLLDGFLRDIDIYEVRNLFLDFEIRNVRDHGLWMFFY
jgi:hypothetical protein